VTDILERSCAYVVMGKPSRATRKRQVRHPVANAEARSLVERHDGMANRVVESKLEHSLVTGDIDGALHLDQVRREIERVEHE